jgi:hypothetical protein
MTYLRTAAVLALSLPACAVADADPAPTTASAPAPLAVAWPDASTTGWAHTGVTLARHDGDLNVTTNGTIVDSLDVHGDINVRANNVTIRRSRIVHGQINNTRRVNNGGVITETQYTGLVVEDVEFDGRPFESRVTAYRAPLGGNEYTARRCDVHHWGDGFIARNNVLIEDSYIHDLISEGDPASTGSHNYAAGGNGGSHVIIRHNRLECSADNCSATVPFYGDFEPLDDILVQNNLINGGQYCIMGGSIPAKPFPNATRIRFLDNRLGRKYFPACGHYGPATYFDSAGTGNQWANNVWDDTGAVVAP